MIYDLPSGPRRRLEHVDRALKVGLPVTSLRDVLELDLQVWLNATQARRG